jgi:hypothetical protein
VLRTVKKSVAAGSGAKLTALRGGKREGTKKPLASQTGNLPAGGETKKTFLIDVVGKQNATWQGTITLLGRNATRTLSLPHAANGRGHRETVMNNKETILFRSMLELIHIINDALEDEEAEEAEES